MSETIKSNVPPMPEQPTKLCKHCQTQIPKNAKVCPNCRKKQSGILKWIIIVVVVLVIIAAISGGSGDDSSNTNKPSSPQTGDVGILGFIGIGIASIAGVFANNRRKR